MTDKMIEEEELKGLENEIDAAVDRLFVEKGRPPMKSVSTAPSLSGAFQETKGEVEKEIEWESVPPLSFAPAPSNPLEKLESQLLSLEWEINKENLKSTVEEVLILLKDFGKTPQISTLLNRMVQVLNFMIQNEEAIQPHLIRFLLDSKETIQLMMKKDEGEEAAIYKKLAFAGIEARFACLEEFQAPKPKPVPVAVDRLDQQEEPFQVRPDLSSEIMRRMETFSESLNKLVEKIDQHLSMHEKLAISPAGEPQGHEVPFKTSVTVFKTGERLFGIESDRVLKLFKVPSALSKQIVQLKKFKLKELAVRMVDLKSVFSIDDDQEGERQVLILKGEEEYKGVMMDRVLSRLSGPLEQAREFNEYLLGMIRWTYEDLPIRVPILDLKKL